ncbi:hypothetical protein MTO96_023202 [Rhipicephalus appendiculatus]|uniref:Copper transport protein n=2 Tax=Rhipicephalus TaxID=426455 RepID=A0A131YQD9_RHIAP
MPSLAPSRTPRQQLSSLAASVDHCQLKMEVMGHQSYFEFSSHVENLLFRGLSASSLGGMLGMCLGVAAFSVLYESITASRHYVTEVHKQSLWAPSQRSRLEASPDASQVNLLYGHMDAERWGKLKFRLLQTLLHALQLTLGFLVMLIIMRYNGWIAISVLLASGLAHHCLSRLVMPARLLPVSD